MIALRWLLLPGLLLTAAPSPAPVPVPQKPDELTQPSDPDRNLALSAISAARNALQQAGKDSPRRDEAAKQLADAEQLFKTAHYPEAAKAADGAWRLVSDHAGAKTQFTVEVAKDGKTEVKSTAGQPVRVEAQGTVSPVYPGQVVAVVKGEAPRRVENATAPTEPDKKLAPPVLTAPNDKGALTVKEVSKGTLAPVTLSWKPVDGAAAYEVEVVRSGSGKPIAVKVDKPQAQIDGLSPGSYQWSVRAVADGARSERSGKRTFEVSAEGFKLEVKDTKWK